MTEARVVPRTPLTETEFDERFTLVDAPNGEQTWEYHQMKAEEIPPNRAWSLMDGDCDTLWAGGGYHVVNVYGYWVTKETHDYEDVQLDTDPVCGECYNREEEHKSEIEAGHVEPHEWKGCE